MGGAVAEIDQRMRMMRSRRQERDRRELHLFVPDARLEDCATGSRRSCTAEPRNERDALFWIEIASEFYAVQWRW